MSPTLMPLLIAATVPLVIPAAILLGHRRRNGPMIVSSGLAAAAFAVFWLVLGGVTAFNGYTPADETGILTRIILLFCGVLLLLAGWALALGAAASARRLRWFALLVASGYLSFIAILISIVQPDACMFGPKPGVFPACTTGPNPLAELLVIAGYFAAPVVVLVYGSGAPALRRALADGLTASAITSTNTVPDADEFEVHLERME